MIDIKKDVQYPGDLSESKGLSLDDRIPYQAVYSLLSHPEYGDPQLLKELEKEKEKRGIDLLRALKNG